ncbi:FAD-dependent oxidoreductase [Clostridium saccharoperbutylacetonicum]|uniref:oxidoreductase n=1 Tax=Clostridium saccharoperbutylacetonicum TaxID=36745 RepID=UPI0039E93FED
MLFQKGKIGNLVIKNRIAMAPMGQPADIDGGFTQSNIDYLVERAKGGVGLIITGCTVCSEEFEPRPCNLHNNFHQNDRLGKLADQIHMYGSKLCLQLSPGIGRMNFIDPFTPPYSSSQVPSYAFPDLICKEMPTEGVKHLVKAMGYSAQLAMRAGVDMVEVHAYGGYLIDQFTSAYWNKRTDEYGGSFENRTRFLTEIITEIRKTCGPNFPIAVKLTIDSVDGLERPLEEGIAIAKMLDEMSIDLLHIGRGAYSCRWRMVSSVYQQPGFDIEAVKKIKEVVKNVPIMAHGKLNHKNVAEKALKENTVDFVAIGHGLLADPHWANKVRSNKLDEIIPCIGCGECHYNAMNGKILSCAVTPTTGYEKEYVLTPATEAKNILVIGGGPGGMKAAITAAQRGFKVSLWERNTYLGGEMTAAGAPRFKEDVMSHVEYLSRQVYKYNIDLKLGLTATVEDVIKYNPDYVVVATGATPIMIRVPGYDKKHVVMAEEVLLNQRSVGENVVIIGGGLVGSETAVELAMEGKKVKIVEMMDDILKTASHFVANDQNLRYLVNESCLKIISSAKLTEILDDGVVVEKDGKMEKVECDTVVFAVGFRSNQELYDQIQEAGFDAVVIGDNVRPGKIIHAIHQGYHAIRVL